MAPSLLIIRASWFQWPSGRQLYLPLLSVFYSAVTIKAVAVHCFCSSNLDDALFSLPLPSLPSLRSLPLPLPNFHPCCHCHCYYIASVGTASFSWWPAQPTHLKAGKYIPLILDLRLQHQEQKPRKMYVFYLAHQVSPTAC